MQYTYCTLQNSLKALLINKPLQLEYRIMSKQIMSNNYYCGTACYTVGFGNPEGTAVKVLISNTVSTLWCNRSGSDFYNTVEVIIYN